MRKTIRIPSGNQSPAQVKKNKKMQKEKISQLYVGQNGKINKREDNSSDSSDDEISLEDQNDVDANDQTFQNERGDEVLLNPRRQSLFEDKAVDTATHSFSMQESFNVLPSRPAKRFVNSSPHFAENSSNKKGRQLDKSKILSHNNSQMLLTKTLSSLKQFNEETLEKHFRNKGRQLMNQDLPKISYEEQKLGINTSPKRDEYYLKNGIVDDPDEEAQVAVSSGDPNERTLLSSNRMIQFNNYESPLNEKNLSKRYSNMKSGFIETSLMSSNLQVSPKQAQNQQLSWSKSKRQERQQSRQTIYTRVNMQSQMLKRGMIDLFKQDMLSKLNNQQPRRNRQMQRNFSLNNFTQTNTKLQYQIQKWRDIKQSKISSQNSSPTKNQGEKQNYSESKKKANGLKNDGLLLSQQLFSGNQNQASIENMNTKQIIDLAMTIRDKKMKTSQSQRALLKNNTSINDAATNQNTNNQTQEKKRQDGNLQKAVSQKEFIDARTLFNYKPSHHHKRIMMTAHFNQRMKNRQGNALNLQSSAATLNEDLVRHLQKQLAADNKIKLEKSPESQVNNNRKASQSESPDYNSQTTKLEMSRDQKNRGQLDTREKAHSQQDQQNQVDQEVLIHTYMQNLLQRSRLINSRPQLNQNSSNNMQQTTNSLKQLQMEFEKMKDNLSYKQLKRLQEKTVKNEKAFRNDVEKFLLGSPLTRFQISQEEDFDQQEFELDMINSDLYQQNNYRNDSANQLLTQQEPQSQAKKINRIQSKTQNSNEGINIKQQDKINSSQKNLNQQNDQESQDDEMKVGLFGDRNIDYQEMIDLENEIMNSSIDYKQEFDKSKQDQFGNIQKSSDDQKIREQRDIKVIYSSTQRNSQNSSNLSIKNSKTQRKYEDDKQLFKISSQIPQGYAIGKLSQMQRNLLVQTNRQIFNKSSNLNIQQNLSPQQQNKQNRNDNQRNNVEQSPDYRYIPKFLEQQQHPLKDQNSQNSAYQKLDSESQNQQNLNFNDDLIINENQNQSQDQKINQEKPLIEDQNILDNTHIPKKTLTQIIPETKLLQKNKVFDMKTSQPTIVSNIQKQQIKNFSPFKLDRQILKMAQDNLQNHDIKEKVNALEDFGKNIQQNHQENILKNNRQEKSPPLHSRLNKKYSVIDSRQKINYPLAQLNTENNSPSKLQLFNGSQQLIQAHQSFLQNNQKISQLLSKDDNSFNSSNQNGLLLSEFQNTYEEDIQGLQHSSNPKSQYLLHIYEYCMFKKSIQPTLTDEDLKSFTNEALQDFNNIFLNNQKIPNQGVSTGQEKVQLNTIEDHQMNINQQNAQKQLQKEEKKSQQTKEKQKYLVKLRSKPIDEIPILKW